MQTFTIRQNDRLPSISATLQDAADVPVDLTAAVSVTFNMRSVEGPLVVSSPAAFVDRLTGRVSYDWAEGDTADPGKYRAEFEVLWSGARTETYPNVDYITVLIPSEVA